ncbi:MAG: hypothetical protein WCE90_11250 [Candidatus Zixiibacteriota bacterium]
MKKLSSLLQIFLILMVVSTACTKKATTPIPGYREPLSFEIFKAYEGAPLDSNYVKKIHDTWQNELKDDEIIKNHTWLVGDYRVFVYLHVYSFFSDTNYYEMLFFTTTQPKKSTDQIQSTITAFVAEFQDTLVGLTKIKTFINVNDYHPIENEDEAKGIMIDYLNEYLAKYDTLSYDRSLINEFKKDFQADNYTWDWEDHYVYYRSPGDFGGAIIVNKLTSKLDFLGSSVWMGYGKRYFPSD